MKLPETIFARLDWDILPSVEYPREAGTSHWRSFNSGDLRMRIVDYGSGESRLGSDLI
jgi:hypothetical protein